MSEKGTGHFIAQRFTAICMVFLVGWFLVAIIGHLGDTRDEIMTWLATPITGVPFTLLIVMGFIHMRIGMSEIIDDYIHDANAKGMLQFLNTLFTLVVGGICIWSIIYINLVH